MRRALKLPVAAVIPILSVFLITGRAAATDEPLTVGGAVAEALANHPELLVLKNRIESARARAKQAPFLEDPELAIQFNGVPFSQPANLNQADWNSIGVRQKLPFFGKLGLKEKAAEEEVNIADQELRAKYREIMLMVKMAYADFFMAQRSAEILREQLDIMRTVINATESRYRVGRVAQQDVFKAQLEQTEMLNQLGIAEQDSNAAMIRLNTAMYRPPRTPIEVPAELSLPDFSATAASLDELALANRPELKAADAEIARSEKIHDLAERNRKYPDFMVGWDYMRMPTEMKYKDRYGAMVNITIPFSPWTAGRRNYEAEESLAEIRAARSNRDAMRNTTLKQVGESFAKLQAAKRSIELYRGGLLSQAELSFRSALTAYQTGRVDFVNLLEAQRALRDARMGYYKATAAFVQNLAELERAVGRDLQ